MTTANTQAIERYRNNFLKEVEANVEEGHMVKMINEYVAQLNEMGPSPMKGFG